MVPFAGWEMPLRYTSMLSEAKAVRATAGIFDVSHMARLELGGSDSSAFLEYILTAHITDLQPGRAAYAFLLNFDGGIIDDAVVVRLSSEPPHAPFLLVCNASSRDTVLSWLDQQRPAYPNLEIKDSTDSTAMVAVQGPESLTILAGMTDTKLDEMRPFGGARTRISLPAQQVVDAIVSRTGYTGEIGFEVVIAAEEAMSLWSHLLDAGAMPCGLGARDILRLEAGLMLSGTDINPTVTPFEAGLDRFIYLDKKAFIGRQALVNQRSQGASKRLVGFHMLARSIPRKGQPILFAGLPIGEVTSGGYSPSLDIAIGLGYVSIEHSTHGTDLTINLRGREVPARVVNLPFYRRTTMKTDL
jgi:aminomethyltransferase